MNEPTTPKTYAIPKGTPARACRECGAEIFFITTEKGRAMPVTADGVSHFATCTNPKRFRKKDRAKQGAAR